METLRVYLENMFQFLPKSKQVLDAKEELFAMMEDKYRALLEEGKSVQEATGVVISEFGNLEEVAESLGIRQEMSKSKEVRVLDREELERIVALNASNAKKFAEGAFLLCFGAFVLMLILAFSQVPFEYYPEKFGLIGVFLLLGFVALSVWRFVSGGMNAEKLNFLEEESVQLSFDDATWLRRERESSEFPKKIVLSVSSFILGSVIAPAALLIFEDSDGWILCAISLMILLTGIGLRRMLTAVLEYRIYDRLLGEGDDTPEKREVMRKMGGISWLYWSAVIFLYLVISLATKEWGRAALIFSPAGMMFIGLVNYLSYRYRHNGR